jgi:PAS domain S-box-containing protein
MRRHRYQKLFRTTRRPPAAGPRRVNHRPVSHADIADKVPVMLFTYDLQEHRLLHCNQHCRAVLGYSTEELAALGPKIMPCLLHSEALAQYEASSPAKLLARRPELRWECRVRHRDGSFRWLRIRSWASAVGFNGEVQQINGSAEDITRHRATVDELRQKRYLLRQIVDIAPSLIYIYDLRAQLNLYCNRRIESLLGYSAEEIQELGSTVLEYTIPLDDAQRFRAHLAEVATLPDGAILKLEYTLVHRDGSLRWVRTTHTPFERDADGQVYSIIGVAEDITGQRDADERSRTDNRRLTEQHRLFREVIDALPHPIYLKDGFGHYLLANKTSAGLFGMSPDELVSQGVASLPASAHEHLARWIAQDQHVLTTHQDLTVEETFTLPDGKELWFSSVKRLFTRADGTEQVLGIDSNITELKYTQRALEKAKEAAEENAHAKQDFLANMSHEIRTPLHGIIGLTEVLAKTKLSRSQLDYLRLLSNSAEHLLTVLNDVLTTARLGTGKLQPEVLAFAPRELLLGCAALLRPRAREKSLKLRVEAPPLPILLGDAHRLRQVLLNLVSNAIKFTEQGQVKLSYQRQPPPNGTTDQIWLRFTITDTGIGIGADTLPKIFEPFTQAAASTDREYGGSGLGLSISQGLVELMGGQLEVASTLGAGSTFCFTLPFALEPIEAPAAPVLPPPTAAPAPPPPTGRVLLVEDNLVNSLLAETVLRNWGWQVTVAMSGAAAIQLFEHRPFDVVLMDIQMPGMDGETAAQALRRHPDPVRAATPIVALTARTQPGEAERLLASGFSGYLAKPFREEQLLEALRTVLANRAAQPSSIYPTPPLMSSTAPLYDLSNVRQLVQNDETVVRRLAWAFIQTTPAILTALDEALTKRNWQGLSDAAHHLKSSLDGLGVESLRTVIREVESYNTDPPAPAQAAQQVAQVRAVTEQVMAALRTEFPEE